MLCVLMEKENTNTIDDDHMGKKMKGSDDGGFEGFDWVSSTRIDWKPRNRSLISSAGERNVDKVTEDTANNSPDKQEASIAERRKALFEPLEPITNINGERPSAESLLPPPDFDTTTCPKGWLIGKKRKLVNVDVVEKMWTIAVQEMNRKDMEIDGLNEQLEEDARCLEHLQLQLLQERSKRSEVERENAMLQNQITMLMNMLQDDTVDDEGPEEP